MVGQTFRMARKDREMDRPQVEIPESTQASQPLQIYQAIRLVHHQEVRGILFFSIALIISIAIVFDFNENLAKFSENHAPMRAIIFDYYANFVPYFANLFSALFVFIAVILFTTKMAGNSEIIAILASGTSFKRLMRPYMLTCVMLSALSYSLSAYVIPHGTVIRQNFENMYKKKAKNTSADNVQLQVDRGVIAYIQHYDNTTKRGYGFCLDKFQEKSWSATLLRWRYSTIPSQIPSTIGRSEIGRCVSCKV